MNAYIRDILSQPAVLRAALDNYSFSALERVNLTEFDRIIISGMGSSFYAAYPAWIELSKQSVPVQLVNAAELLHSLHGLIGRRSLLWLNSQSGRSAELVHLLDKIQSRPPGGLLTLVNDVSSPMGQKADICIPIHAGEEATVSTKTYTNMLATNLLVSIQLSGGDVDSAIRQMRDAADVMEAYLSIWEERMHDLDTALGQFDQLFLIGRGASMSAVWQGSLTNKEAAKAAFEAMPAADFRHGPLEIVSPGFAALIFAGAHHTSGLNRELAREILSYGGKAIWLDSVSDPDIPTVVLPQISDLARPLVEILTMQMLTLAMARRNHVEAGTFHHVTKITDRE